MPVSNFQITWIEAKVQVYSLLSSLKTHQLTLHIMNLVLLVEFRCACFFAVLHNKTVNTILF